MSYVITIRTFFRFDAAEFVTVDQNEVHVLVEC